MDAVILGISPDSIDSHRKFKKKYALPYLLLVDEGHRLSDAYGIWKEKSLYGVKYMGVERTTVIIGRDGLIRKRLIGATDWNSPQNRGLVERLLADGARGGKKIPPHEDGTRSAANNDGGSG